MKGIFLGSAILGGATIGGGYYHATNVFEKEAINFRDHMSKYDGLTFDNVEINKYLFSVVLKNLHYKRVLENGKECNFHYLSDFQISYNPVTKRLTIYEKPEKIQFFVDEKKIISAFSKASEPNLYKVTFTKHPHEADKPFTSTEIYNLIKEINVESKNCSLADEESKETILSTDRTSLRIFSRGAGTDNIDIELASDSQNYLMTSVFNKYLIKLIEEFIPKQEGTDGEKEAIIQVMHHLTSLRELDKGNRKARFSFTGKLEDFKKHILNTDKANQELPSFKLGLALTFNDLLYKASELNGFIHYDALTKESKGDIKWKVEFNEDSQHYIGHYLTLYSNILADILKKTDTSFKSFTAETLNNIAPNLHALGPVAFSALWDFKNFNTEIEGKGNAKFSTREHDISLEASFNPKTGGTIEAHIKDHNKFIDDLGGYVKRVITHPEMTNLPAFATTPLMVDNYIALAKTILGGAGKVEQRNNKPVLVIKQNLPPINMLAATMQDKQPESR